MKEGVSFVRFSAWPKVFIPTLSDSVAATGSTRPQRGVEETSAVHLAGESLIWSALKPDVLWRMAAGK